MRQSRYLTSIFSSLHLFLDILCYLNQVSEYFMHKCLNSDINIMLREEHHKNFLWTFIHHHIEVLITSFHLNRIQSPNIHWRQTVECPLCQQWSLGFFRPTVHQVIKPEYVSIRYRTYDNREIEVSEDEIEDLWYLNKELLRAEVLTHIEIHFYILYSRNETLLLLGHSWNRLNWIENGVHEIT